MLRGVCTMYNLLALVRTWSLFFLITLARNLMGHRHPTMRYTCVHNLRHVIIERDPKVGRVRGKVMLPDVYIDTHTL